VTVNHKAPERNFEGG